MLVEQTGFEPVTSRVIGEVTVAYTTRIFLIFYKLYISLNTYNQRKLTTYIMFTMLTEQICLSFCILSFQHHQELFSHP